MKKSLLCSLVVLNSILIGAESAEAQGFFKRMFSASAREEHRQRIEQEKAQKRNRVQPPNTQLTQPRPEVRPVEPPTHVSDSERYRREFELQQEAIRKQRQEREQAAGRNGNRPSITNPDTMPPENQVLPNPPRGPEVMPGDKPDQSAHQEFSSQRYFNMPMIVTNPEWTPEHEVGFGELVTSIGNAVRNKKCGSVKNCMRNPDVNPYAKYDPKGLVLYSDCADFPYFLRAYYAYQNGLPFSYAAGLKINTTPVSSPNDRDADLATARLDNSPYGNAIMGRMGSNVSSRPGEERNFVDYLNRMFDQVSTRTFRVGPLNPGAHLTDVYPVKLDRTGIGPGTVVHSTGHLYMVIEVDAKGVIHMVDAHPDGSLSYKIIKASTLDRSRPDQGLGFFKFRPLGVVGGREVNGAIYGGKIQPASNEALFREGLYSLEQWFGPESNIAPNSQVTPTQFKTAFAKMNFFDHLNRQLRDPNLMIPADQEVAELMDSLCTEMKQRVADVDKAITNKGPQLPHPTELPDNIFSTTGFWEDYSTPSRDARMKASIGDIRKAAINKYRQAKVGGYGVSFNGTAQEYQQALRNQLNKMNESCKVTYKKSDGNAQTLNFSQMVSRLNKMSFDPYHCPERRWGASGTELATCRDRDSKGEWYEAQAFMRNVAGKLTPNEKLTIRSTRPITLDMLRDRGLIDQPESSQINLGTAKEIPSNLDAYFASEEFLKALN